MHERVAPAANERAQAESVGVSRPAGLIQRACTACSRDEDAPVQRRALDGGAAPAAAVAAPRGNGRPLPAPVLGLMQSRFAHDFSDVRVHADAAAAQSAQSLSARAYTHGRDVLFGAGEYAPGRREGLRLIAHELAHVVQQRGMRAAPQTQLAVSTPGDAGEREADAAADAVMSGGAVPRLGPAAAGVQRKCGAALGKPSPACVFDPDFSIGGWDFPFVVNCDDLRPGGDKHVGKFTAGSTLDIHGFASVDGPAAFNLDLSCHRANKVADLLRARRPDCTIGKIVSHGGATSTPMFPGPTDPNFWRSVLVEEHKAVKPNPDDGPKANCGPDATDWLVLQMVAGKKNAKVNAIRSKLDAAAISAPMIGKGFFSQDIVEGAIVEKINALRAADPTLPRPTADANAQLGEPSAVFGFAELQAAKGAALGLGITAQSSAAIATLTLLRDASIAWRDLVNHKAPYDFKRDPGTMGDPKSDHCPDNPPAESCANTITLCGGSPGANCFVKDLPGNVFYAHVGGFAGFSENALQLGSQFAQLLPGGGKHWDPPEDTAMIDFGFNLPTPLTRATFCAALQTAKGGFDLRKCKDCGESKMFNIVDP